MNYKELSKLVEKYKKLGYNVETLTLKEVIELEKIEK